MDVDSTTTAASTTTATATTTTTTTTMRVPSELPSTLLPRGSAPGAPALGGGGGAGNGNGDATPLGTPGDVEMTPLTGGEARLPNASPAAATLRGSAPVMRRKSDDVNQSWLLEENGDGFARVDDFSPRGHPLVAVAAVEHQRPYGACVKWGTRIAIGAAFVWTFITFVLSINTKTCWTAYDELQLLNKFNTVSFMSGEGPIPLSHAHSHNDYVNPKPLVEALMAGFCSVEGDVHLHKGELWLGHDEPGSTKIKDVYLAALAAQARKTGTTVFRRAVPLGTCLQVTLLVDAKSVDKRATWQALDQLIKDEETKGGAALPDGRTVFQTYDKTGAPIHSKSSGLPSPIRVILTGINNDSGALADLMLSADVHRMKLDLDHVPEAGTNLAKVAGWVSQKWTGSWSWPPADAAAQADLARRLRERASAAHALGLVTRFWDTPENVQLWDLLLASGIDLINTDLIFSLHSFLSGSVRVNTLE